jgi:hypothetical protein
MDRGRKNKRVCFNFEAITPTKTSTPGRTRTCDIPLRRRVLYPAELLAQKLLKLSQSDAKAILKPNFINNSIPLLPDNIGFGKMMAIF